MVKTGILPMSSSAGDCLSQINVCSSGLIETAMPMAKSTFQEGVMLLMMMDDDDH